MNKSFAKKALCIALASAMVFGEAGTALAATTNAPADSTAATADYGDSFKAEITSFNVEGLQSDYDDDIYITATGYGSRAEVLVNGNVYDTVYGNSYDGSWYMYTDFDVAAGASYEISLVVYGTDNDVVSRKWAKINVPAPKLKSGSLSAYSNSNITETGYRQATGISVRCELESDCSRKYGYEIYRSTNSRSGFVKVNSGYTWGGSSVSVSDDKAVSGKTYYYKIKLVTVTDSYIKTSKVLATSGVVKAVSGKPEVSFDVEKNGSAVDVTMNDYGVANQFDIYRSTKKSSGYKKIKTIYTPTYTDKTVKSGKTYYYKVVPKYYDKSTGKTIVGVKTGAKGVVINMDNISVELNQASATAVRASWDRVSGANAYEVWYKDSDISGDCYRKAGITKGTSYVIRGLVAGDNYSFVIKAQKKSAGRVVYENTSNYESIRLAYNDSLRNLEAVSKSTSISKDKKTLKISTRLKWSKNYGASGYIVTAYNRYTGKTEQVKKISSANTTTYVFTNTATSSKGMKYSNVNVAPYKGRNIGTPSTIYKNYIDRLPYAKNVKAVRKSGKEAKITWSAVPGASRYSVYRTSPFAGPQWIGDVKTTNFVDKNITTSTEYTYVICPYSSFEFVYSPSAWENSTIASKAYVHKLSTPKISSAKNSASKSVDIKWSEIANAKYYLVYRSTSKNGKYTRVAAVKSTGRSYTDKKLAKGKTYYYKLIVKAVNDGGRESQSAASKPVGVKITK